MDVESISALQSAQVQAQVQVSLQKQLQDSQEALVGKIVSSADSTPAPRAAGQSGQRLNIIA